MLVRKFVKHTKVLCSRAANQASLDQSRLAKTQSHIRATAAWVLGKADPAVRQKLGQFDPANGVVHNLADLLRTCLTRPLAAGQVLLSADGDDLSTPHLVRRLA